MGWIDWIRCRLAMWLDAQSDRVDNLANWISPPSEIWNQYNQWAERYEDGFFIGVDSCRENLHIHSRKAPLNALFVIASAQALPGELNGLASHVSIHFPWGSLLESLLDHDAGLISSLGSVTHPRAVLDVSLNADAPALAGWDLESGADHIERVLGGSGWNLKSRSLLDAGDLRAIPTTWAKRLLLGAIRAHCDCA